VHEERDREKEIDKRREGEGWRGVTPRKGGTTNVNVGREVNALEGGGGQYSKNTNI